MHVDISYKGEANPEAKALKDIEEYLGPKGWEALQTECKKVKTVKDVQSINYCLAFVGVSGYPVHVFISVKFPHLYEDWYNSLPD